MCSTRVQRPLHLECGSFLSLESLPVVVRNHDDDDEIEYIVKIINSTNYNNIIIALIEPNYYRDNATYVYFLIPLMCTFSDSSTFGFI